MAVSEGELNKHAVLGVALYVLGIGTQGDPLSAAGALERNEFFVFAVHVPASLFTQSLGIKEDVGVSVSPCFCGIRSPPHRAFAAHCTLPLGRLLASGNWHS